jgi:hypothetical protein
VNEFRLTQFVLREVRGVERGIEDGMPVANDFPVSDSVFGSLQECGGHSSIELLSSSNNNL